MNKAPKTRPPSGCTWWHRAVASALPLMTVAAMPLAEPAGAAPPQIVSESPSALATSVQTSAGTWATVPMGHLDQPLNTFWQLFFRASGTSSWSNATSTLATATNGGLIIATPDGQSVEVGIRPANRLTFSTAPYRLTDAAIVDHGGAPGWPGCRQQRFCHRRPQRKLDGPRERPRRCACGLERPGPFDLADADDRGGVGLLGCGASLSSPLHHCRWLRRSPSFDRWWMPACGHGRHFLPKQRSMASCRTHAPTTARPWQRRRDQPETDERGNLGDSRCDICQRGHESGRRLGRKRESVERFWSPAAQLITACIVRRSGRRRWDVRPARRL